MRAARRVLTALALNLCTGVVATPTASARGTLVVGMPIHMGRHNCTLRFFGLNSDLGLVYSNMVQLPGDSGCPWVTNGRTLVAMGSTGALGRGCRQSGATHRGGDRHDP